MVALLILLCWLKVYLISLDNTVPYRARYKKTLIEKIKYVLNQKLQLLVMKVLAFSSMDKRVYSGSI